MAQQRRPIYSIEYVAKHAMAQGFVATKEILAGTMILSETPVFTIPFAFMTETQTTGREQFIKSQITQLPHRTNQQFLSLENYFPSFIDPQNNQRVDTPYTGTILTNAIPLSVGTNYTRSNDLGVFLELSKINHSCRPNAQQTWNQDLGVETLYSLYNIEKGEEITISYCPESRIDPNFLQTTFRFECACASCLYPQTVIAIRQGNNNRAEIERKSLAYKYAEKDDPMFRLKLCWEQYGQIQEEGITDWRLGSVLSNAFACVAQMNLRKRATILKKMACEALVLCEGSDSYHVRILEEKCAVLDADDGEAINEHDHRMYETNVEWLFMINRREVMEEADRE